MFMSHQQALETLLPHRGQRIVVTTMTSAGIWPAISDTGLDFCYIPSSMGQGTALALGFALAQPERGVILLNGDGCTLMNLGSLVTLAQHQGNVFVVVLDNGLYEVTGGQPLAGAGRTDFAQIARGAGIERVYSFATLEEWRRGAGEAFSGKGPVVIWLKVEARIGQKTPKAPRPMTEQIQRLRQAIARPISSAPGTA